MGLRDKGVAWCTGVVRLAWVPVWCAIALSWAGLLDGQPRGFLPPTRTMALKDLQMCRPQTTQAGVLASAQVAVGTAAVSTKVLQHGHCHHRYC